MNKILSSLIVTSIVIVGSTTTSIAQEVKERAAAQLNVAKTQKVKRDVCKAFYKEDVERKNILKVKPRLKNANLKTQTKYRRME